MARSLLEDRVRGRQDSGIRMLGSGLGDMYSGVLVSRWLTIALVAMILMMIDGLQKSVHAMIRRYTNFLLLLR